MDILDRVVGPFDLGVRELIIYASCTLVLAWATHMLLQWRRKVSMVNRLPGPFSLPIIGNALELLVSPRELFHNLCTMCRYHQGIHRLWVAHVPYILLYKPEKLEMILSSSIHINKGRDYSLVHPWLGSSLLVSKGPKWHSRGKMLTDLEVGFKILDNFIEVFNKEALKFVNIIAKEANRCAGTINIYPHVTRCTLDIICETAMGVNINSQDGTKTEYLDALLKINSLTQARSVHPWLRSDLLYFLFGSGREYNQYLGVLHQLTRNTIKTKKEKKKKPEIEKTRKISNIIEIKKRAAYIELLEHVETEPEFTDDETSRNFTFLERLLEYAETDPEMTDEHIREEVNNFIFAGHDATASAISWTIYLLGLHPSIQELAYAEVMTVAGVQDHNINMTHLPKLKYLDCCIKETLRIFPAVPIFAREITKEIKIDNYVLPVGATIEVITYKLHRDKEHFPEPEAFRPERFSAEECKGQHPYAHVPFGVDPRLSSIGQKFAMLEMKVILATVLKKFKITSQVEQDIEVVGELILRPEDSIIVKLEPRTSSIIEDISNDSK